MLVCNNHLYRFGVFRLDAKNGLLWRGDEVVPLKPKAVGLLNLLVQRPGQVLTKQEIMDALWPDAIVEEANLTQTVHLLRKALAHDTSPQPLIETVPKIGYRWVCETRAAEPFTQQLANHSQPAPEPVRPTAAVRVLTQPSTSATLTMFATLLSPAAAPPSPPLNSPQQWWRKRPLALTTLVMVVLAGALSSVFFFRRHNGPLVDSVAVLPFRTRGLENPDPSLSLGLADVLITRLGMLGQLEVRPTAAITRFNESQTDALTIGQQLGVEAILTGYIHPDHGRIRLTVQLVRVRDGKALWTGAFDEKFSDLFRLEDDLTQQVTAALRLPFKAGQRSQMQDYGTTNLEAWQLYQQGRYFWNKRQWAQTKKALKAFEQALQLDPNYAQAYAGLADSYALWNPEMTPRERLDKAKPAAERALALNARLAEAHASMGFIKYKFEWDWRGAEAAFQQALALNSNYATAHHWYGESLSLHGRHVAALAQLQEAEQLDPLSFPIKEDIGMAYYRARDFSRAERKLREVIELDPTFFRARYKLSEVLQAQGRQAEAMKERVAFWTGTQAPPEFIATLQQAFQQAGAAACARAELAWLARAPVVHDPHHRARLAARAGDPEQTLIWLEKSFAELGEGPLRINEPEFDLLRHDPRFHALLQRAGHL